MRRYLKTALLYAVGLTLTAVATFCAPPMRTVKTLPFKHELNAQK